MKKNILLILLLQTTLCFAQQRQNLLENPGCVNGNLEGWSTFQTGFDLWSISNEGISGSKCWEAGESMTSKSQVVDLVEAGYSTTWLDQAPIVVFADWVRSGVQDFEYDKIFFSVVLLDEDFNTIDSYYKEGNTGQDWIAIKGSLRDYGPGLRFIKFEHGGEDGPISNFNTGPLFDGSYLAIGNHLFYSSGHTGDMAGWDIIQDGGSGWDTKEADGYRMYITSNELCTKSQTVDLWGDIGYNPSELDLQPLIQASNFFIGTEPNLSDVAFLNVKLLDENMNVIAEHNSDDIICSNIWKAEYAVFTNYGTGLRYIYFEHGGIDAENMTGHHGALFDQGQILIDFSNVSSDEEKHFEPYDFSISPNPSSGLFNLDLSQFSSKTELMVFDLSGKVVLQKTLAEQDAFGTHTMNLSELENGAYTLRIVNENKVGLERLVIQK